MADVYLPGGILSMASGAAERLISEGNGDAALLYLWLLKNGGTYQALQVSKTLRWDIGRCDNAFAALIRMGLADGMASHVPPVPLAEEEPPDYSSRDITWELKDSASTFSALVLEVQRRLGKVLSTADLKCLYTIHDFVALPPEVTLLVVNWCVQEWERKYGPGRRPRLPEIQREALNWKERGVDTVEAAESYLKRLELLRDRITQILALLNVRGRPAVTREREYIESWLNMGFDNEAIRMAYERTVLKKQSLNWPYMNSILNSWHQKKLHTASEISTGDTLSKSGKGKSTLDATVPQPVSSGGTNQQMEEDMEWVQRFLKNQE